MGTYTASRAKHATLAASVVDTITLDTQSLVEVSNWGGGRIYLTTDGTTPVVAGDDTLVVGPGGSLKVSSPVGSGGSSFIQSKTTVKLIAAATADYSVTAL